MDSRSAATGTPDPDAVEFVRFCYHRRRVGWPELYDEMCAVAGRGLFRGYDADDLAGLGIGFSLFDMPALSILAGRVIAEEQARRRPVSVTITAAAVPEETESETPAVVTPSVTVVATPTANGLAANGRVANGPVAGDHAERTLDVPIRLRLVPSRA